jgi:hypothetical protein
MLFRNILRKLLLSVVLGGHSIFGVGMSQEKMEELLYAMNQTRVEVSISGQDEGLPDNSEEPPVLKK